MSRFQNAIKEIREKNNLTQEQLGDLLGITKTGIFYWESGRSVPSDEMLQRITEEFSVDYNFLLDKNEAIYSMGKNVKLRYLGYGSCGNGAINEEPIEWRDVPEWILGSKKNYDNYFLASAKGDSMERAGIKNGSLLIFYRQPELNNGEIGVFSLNGEEYIKRYSRQGDVIILNSEALKDGYEPIVVTKDDCFTIIAKLYKCITDFE